MIEPTYTLRALVRSHTLGPWHALGTRIPGQAMCGSKMTGHIYRQMKDVTASTFVEGVLTERQCPGCKAAVKAGRPRAYRS